MRVPLVILLALGLAQALPSAAPAAESAPAQEWVACGDAECTTMQVPLDWNEPDGEQIAVAVARQVEDSVLLTYEGDMHHALLVSQCVLDHVEHYFLYAGLRSEAQAVERWGGRVRLTGGRTSSSSALLARYGRPGQGTAREAAR
jgi:hypothetical protein